MTRRTQVFMLAAWAVLLALVLARCESSENIAPEGASISTAANPTTIVLSPLPECAAVLGVPNCGTAQIVATVSSKIGVPLPDQDVRFNSTAGLLFTGTLSSPIPAANIPIATDDLGNALVNLVTSTTTTVTARSGSVTGPLTLNTVQGNLSQVLLNVDTTSTGCSMSTTTVTDCSQRICFVASAEESDGDPVPGVPVIFDLQNNTIMGNTFSGVFTPSQITTNAQGEARSSFVPDSTCTAECGGNKPCQAEVIARTQGGLVSVPQQLMINIP